MIESFTIQSENVHIRNSILKQIRSLNFSGFVVLIMNIIGSLIEIQSQGTRLKPDGLFLGLFGFFICQ